MQRDEALAIDALRACERVLELVAGRSFADFEADVTRNEAVLWNLTLLGESVSQLSGEFRAQHPGIDWRDPIDLRNRLIHGYASVDLEVVFATAQRDIPPFAEQLRRITEDQNRD
jgi:uncharacterized protein with HEPN domain